MERKIANPWKWQDALGFVQANEAARVQRMIFCAGQFSVIGRDLNIARLRRLFKRQ